MFRSLFPGGSEPKKNISTITVWFCLVWGTLKKLGLSICLHSSVLMWTHCCSSCHGFSYSYSTVQAAFLYILLYLQGGKVQFRGCLRASVAMSKPMRRAEILSRSFVTQRLRQQRRQTQCAGRQAFSPLQWCRNKCKIKEKVQVKLEETAVLK